jgi:hypothetical protein
LTLTVISVMVTLLTCLLLRRSKPALPTQFE